jgi:23S rRNA (uracil1939-C5)-methyltransferase
MLEEGTTWHGIVKYILPEDRLMETLTIEKNVFGGYGLGFHHGKATFVPYTIAGEICRVEIITEKKDHQFAGLVSVTEPSPHRITPRCPLAGTCGGCSYQHMAYPHELEVKKDILIQSLERNGSFSPEAIPHIDILSGERFHYRSHGTVTYANGKPGFYRKETHDHIPLPPQGCFLLAEKLNSYLLKTSGDDGTLRVSLSLNGEVKTGKEIVQEQCGSIEYIHPADIFFQANRFMREKMVKLATERDFIENGTVGDVGCGVGLFSIPAAKRAQKVTGYDINRESITWARKNARLNSIGNIEFIHRGASLLHPEKDFHDTIIIDPPRAGMDKKTRKTFLAMEPEQIIYISCNPVTFARDAGLLGSKYRLAELSLLDMFPGTSHMESVALLVKR